MSALTGGLPISGMTALSVMDGTEDFAVRRSTNNFRLNYSTLLTRLTTDLTVSNTLTTSGDILFYDTDNNRLPVGTEGQFLRVSSSLLPAWETVPVLSDPTTSNGDIIYRSGSSLVNLGIGTNGQVLRVSAGGFPEWGTASSYIDPLTTTGDILYRGVSDTIRLPVGVSGNVLRVSSGGIPEWSAPSSTPLATDGDILIYNSGEEALGIGTNGQFLTVGVSGLPVWSTQNIYLDPLTTDGDILYRASGLTTRLSIGTANQVLSVNNSLIPEWNNIQNLITLNDLIPVSSTVLSPSVSEDEYVLTYDNDTSQYELKVAPGTNYIFENGLTDTSNVVTLGGSLNSSTSISGASNDLFINDIGSGQIISGNNGSHESEIVYNTNQLRLRQADVFGSASKLEIDMNSGFGGIIVTDGVFGRGITYAGDYSDGFLNESLVSRRWVEDRFQTIIPLSGTAQNPGAGQDDHLLYWDNTNSVYDLRAENSGGTVITFGSAGQVPFTNGTTDGYLYEPQLSYSTGGFLTVGSLTVGPSTITSSGTTTINSTTGTNITSALNQDVNLTVSGTGSVIIDALTWPGADGTNGQSLITDGSGNLSFTTIAGSGDVTKVGTPVNNQLAVWTGDGTLEGESELTYDGTTLDLTNSGGSNKLTLQHAALGRTLFNNTATGSSINLEGGATNNEILISVLDSSNSSISATTLEDNDSFLLQSTVAATDLGSTAAIRILTNLSGGGGLSTRPLLSFENNITDVFQVSASGDWDYLGGSLLNTNNIRPNTTATSDIGTNVDYYRFIYNSSTYLREASSASSDTAAFGQIWVRDDTPNTLMFTDDAGSDFPVAGDDLEGTHVPTVTSVVNINSSSANNSRYYRVGNNVTVYGNVLINPTSTGATEFRLSLPIASTFSVTHDASGTFTASVGGSYDAGIILPDTVNNEVRFLWNASSSANNTLYYQYSYFIS